MIEIEQIWDKYSHYAPYHRLYKVIRHLKEKSERLNNHQELASRKEIARIFDGMYLNPKTGEPTEIPAMRYVDKLLTKIRKDKGYPLIKPYVQVFVETLTETGEDVLRYYVTFLSGKKHVQFINQMLERQKQALDEIQEENNELRNTKAVDKQLDQYDAYLEILYKNRKGKKKGKGR